MQDKTGKFINVLTSKLKDRTEQVAARDKLISERDATIASLRADLDALTGQVKMNSDLRSSLEQAAREAFEQSRRCGELGHDLANTQRLLDVALDVVHKRNATIEELAQKISEMSVKDELLDQKDADIRALVAKVEDRMRSRERQDAAAILNRKALSAAIPGRNLR